jgi:hypothetical protein
MKAYVTIPVRIITFESTHFDTIKLFSDPILFQTYTPIINKAVSIEFEKVQGIRMHNKLLKERPRRVMFEIQPPYFSFTNLMKYH